MSIVGVIALAVLTAWFGGGLRIAVVLLIDLLGVSTFYHYSGRMGHHRVGFPHHVENSGSGWSTR